MVSKADFWYTWVTFVLLHVRIATVVALLPLLWVPWIFISGGRIATHRSRTSLIELSIMHAELSYDYTSILTFTGLVYKNLPEK